MHQSIKAITQPLLVNVEECNASTKIYNLDEGELSPCLEYLLHHNILDILVTLCQADTPPGEWDNSTLDANFSSFLYSLFAKYT